MAANKLIGVVEVECGSDLYIFKSDFSFLASLHQNVGDPMEIYTEFCNGKSDPEFIKGVMVSAIKLKNGKPINHASDVIESLITKNGLQECWVLCRHLLVYAMIGDIKKSELRKLKPSKLSQIITEPFLLESSKNRRLLWAYHLLISGICACINFSLFVWLFA